jgi:hypothetical protein
VSVLHKSAKETLALHSIAPGLADAAGTMANHIEARWRSLPEQPPNDVGEWSPQEAEALMTSLDSLIDAW